MRGGGILSLLLFQDADMYSEYVSYRYEEDGSIISQGTVLFCPPKHFRFEDPGLQLRVEGDEIVVSSTAYAKGVRIENGSDDLVLSDNFFDLNAEEKRVRILEGEPSDLKVRSIYSIK